MIKKVFSFFICVVMTLSICTVFSACKSSAQNTDVDSAYNTDMIPGGVADISEEVLAALSDSGEVTVYEFGVELSQSRKDFIEYFSEVYGGTVDVRQVIWEGWEKKFISDFAAGDAPDTISLFYKLWPKAANRGMVYSVDELKQLGVIGLDHPVFENQTEVSAQNFSYKGKAYSFGVSYLSAIYCCVNLDLFKEYDVKSPVEYYEEGTWNWDNFVKCSRELSRDLDGDGNNDIYGYYGWDTDWFVVANGAQLVRMDDEGKIYPCFADIAVDNALYNTNKLYKDYKCATSSDTFSTGKVGILAALKTNISKPIGRGDISFNWDIVPFPYGPDNKNGELPGDINGNAIVSSTDNPQGALNYVIASKVFNNMYEAEYDDEKMSVFNENQLQLISDYDVHTNNAFFMGVGTLWNSQWDFWTALKKSANVSEVLESYRPMFAAQCELEMSSSAD